MRRLVRGHYTDRTIMYERYFGLTERPFELTANPRCLVHETALHHPDFLERPSVAPLS